MVIANTIAPNSATLLPTSFAESAGTQDIWHEIAQIDNVEQTGATTTVAHQDLLLDALVPEMLSTESTNLSCKNFRAVHQLEVVLNSVSKVDLVVTTMVMATEAEVTMSNHGNVVQLEHLRRGRTEVETTMSEVQLLPLGPVVVNRAVQTAMAMVVPTKDTVVRLLQLHGSNKLLAVDTAGQAVLLGTHTAELQVVLRAMVHMVLQDLFLLLHRAVALGFLLLRQVVQVSCLLRLRETLLPLQSVLSVSKLTNEANTWTATERSTATTSTILIEMCDLSNQFGTWFGFMINRLIPFSRFAFKVFWY